MVETTQKIVKILPASYVNEDCNFAFNQSFGCTPLLDNTNLISTTLPCVVNSFRAASAIHNDFIKLPKTCMVSNDGSP